MIEISEVKLIFIYNADAGGFFAGVKDTLHKTFRKSTYQCNLCAVTFGAFGMKKEWKKYVNNLDAPVEFFKKDKFKFEFLHKDEFEDKYLIEDAKFPSTKAELINHQGWKVIDLETDKRVHLSKMLSKLPRKTYNGVDDVIEGLRVFM